MNRQLDVEAIQNRDYNLSETTLYPDPATYTSLDPSSTLHLHSSIHPRTVDDGTTDIETHTPLPTHATQDTIIHSSQDSDLMNSPRQPSTLSPHSHNDQQSIYTTACDRSSRVTLSTLTNAELDTFSSGHGDGIGPESDQCVDPKNIRKDEQCHCNKNFGCQNASQSPDQNAAHSLPPMDRGWRAWSVVVGSVLIQTFAFAPTEFIFGVFEQEYLLKFPGASPPSIALIGTIGTSTTYLVGFLSGVLSDRWGYRITSCAGTVVMTLALILASFSKQVHKKNDRKKEFVSVNPLYLTFSPFPRHVNIAVATLLFTGTTIWNREFPRLLCGCFGSITLVWETARTGYGDRCIWIRARWVLSSPSDSVFG